MPALFVRICLLFPFCFVVVLQSGLKEDGELAAAEQQKARPNILVILADDMGYGDVQAYNSKSKIPTPHLNKLAEQGMRFTDAHTPSAVCTPTRYGLLTGRYCWRTRLKKGVLDGYGEPLIEPEQATIAEFLQRAGYVTGIAGKWHLGLGFAKNGNEFDFSKPVSDGPHTHGFDESFVIPASLDFPPYVYVQNGVLTEFPSMIQPARKFPAFMRKGELSPDLLPVDVLDDFVDQASRFIRRQAEAKQPFFLYLPLSAPHKPVLPHDRFRGTTELGPYGDFVAQVDSTVGEVLAALEESGQADDTLVVYTSDNGSFMYRYETDRKDHVDDESIQGYRPEHHTANANWRGTKADVWEAGHRVPFLVRWPGKVTAGGVCETTICLTDLFATAADVVELELPENAAQDSFSILPLLKGEQEFERAPVINHSAAGMFAIRDGKWKLVLGNGSGGRQAPKGKPFAKPYALFDLEADPSETTNVIDEHPEIAADLEERCLAIRDSGRSR
ncbi:sulfatase family protein [Rubinisphaera sp. JC750]|uniref:sulfatase family protein n=1 Tax=Rubinisphaera sp. JC750 TaxID=2898658 RepID=UPI001F2584FE|nr:arylsulfatase [Rubinisphaera sp. JC750]